MTGRHRLQQHALAGVEAHRKCVRERQRERMANLNYRAETNRKCAAYAQVRRAKLREELFAIYGDVCACCGEAEKRFLTLEHKNSAPSSATPSKQRRTVGLEKVWKDAVAARDPARFEILCFNCNIARGRYGVCPHKFIPRHI